MWAKVQIFESGKRPYRKYDLDCVSSGQTLKWANPLGQLARGDMHSKDATKESRHLSPTHSMMKMMMTSTSLAGRGQGPSGTGTAPPSPHTCYGVMVCECRAGCY